MPRLILIDPSLKGFSGHQFEYARRVLAAGRREGLSPILAVNLRSESTSQDLGAEMCRVFKYGVWPGDVVPWCRRNRRRRDSNVDALTATSSFVQCNTAVEANWFKDCGRRWADGVRRRRFTQDLEQWSRVIRPMDDDIVFLPTTTCAELEGCMDLLHSSSSWRRARWHLLFRRDAITPDGRPTAEARCLVRSEPRIAAAYAHDRIACWTDTDELSDQFNALGPLRFSTLPIPVDGVICHETRLGSATRPLRVVFLGDARVEKGFQHLPRLLDQVWDDLVVPGRVQFVVQACAPHRSEPQVEPVLAELARRPSPQVTLLRGPLSSAEYQRQLTQADVVLLPYERRSYVARSSGILAEALAAGIPVVVPDGTWMAEQIAPAKGGRAGVVYRRPEEIGLALRDVIMDHSRFRQSALDLSRPWADYHSPVRLVRMFMQRLRRQVGTHVICGAGEAA